MKSWALIWAKTIIVFLQKARLTEWIKISGIVFIVIANKTGR